MKSRYMSSPTVEGTGRVKLPTHGVVMARAGAAAALPSRAFLLLEDAETVGYQVNEAGAQVPALADVQSIGRVAGM
jgi:hypothetical protein